MPLDPFAAEIVAGLLVNAATAVVSQAAQWRTRGAPLAQIIGQHLDAKAVAARLNAAVAASRALPSHRHQELRQLLQSPEMASVIRQLLAATIVGEPRYERAIRQQLIYLLELSLRLEPKQASKIAELLLTTMGEACRDIANRLQRTRVMPTQDVRAAAWNQLILNHLANIDRVVQCLAGQSPHSLETLEQFEQEYRSQVRHHYRLIIPPNFDHARRIPITRLYVPPRFLPLAPSSHQETLFDVHDTGEGVGGPRRAKKGLNPAILADKLYRTVILGAPGAGKTTFAAKLCYDLAGSASRVKVAGKTLTPMAVVLRDYGAERKKQNISIRDYIEANCRGRFQLDVPQRAIDYLLLTGRALVIFDGLDELLDTSFRATITADVESFCNLYSATPVLVTSRRVGYEEAPLDHHIFEAFYLDDFDDDQVKEYTKKWFSLTGDTSKNGLDRTTSAFLRESQGVRDLRQNPLMLALLCNIWRGEMYLPRHRPDVYEKCATMLFERWDRSRGIVAELPFEAHISSAMKALAHWIYSTERLQSGVTEQALVRKTAEYLVPRRYLDLEEAELAAEAFVKFCRGRAWVFTDTGTTPEGERLYQFTHRTFLEYFAASHLVRMYITPEELWEALKARVARREWDVVAQLSIQMLNKNVEGGADRVLLAMLKSASTETQGQARSNTLLFAARALGFLVPGPKVAGEIAKACMAFSRELALTTASTQLPPPEWVNDRYGMFLITELVIVASENLKAVTQVVERELLAWIEADEDALARLGISLAYHLAMLPAYFGRRHGRNAVREDHWASVSKRIGNAGRASIVNHSRRDYSTAAESWIRGSISTDDLIEWHSPLPLFISWEIPALNTHRSAYASFMLHVTARQDMGSLASNRLREIGQTLSRKNAPWLTIGKLELGKAYSRLSMRELLDFSRRTARLQDRELLWGAICIALCWAELGAPEYPWSRVRIVPQSGPITTIIVGRFSSRRREVALDTLASLGLDDDQTAFLKQWVLSEISVVNS